MVISIIRSALGTVTKGLIQGLEDLKIRHQSGYNPIYSIIKIGSNSEKSHGDLSWLDVT